ncbi:MucB/RseB C-terminal domain-containing protein [Wenzhouxiangella sp. AB-CW3]|uniref:MucB/RseB C-terminal domain-containing protein n=1 Tax=Wenzhouxiangella sp. AB-CW3 TaxID=2771012 RepID=UPI00168AA93B|nr:MucB/RseB C-terminal domain-containing protein [Wenzhouxiangella sp. AB-CW3]QOC23471.1 MucB/RseB C-terminal domain-containing protein [Wenzhouxiangella sp. AB-CW3]
MKASFRNGGLTALTTLWIAALISGPLQADEEVQHWLDRMARAVETLDYRGTLVHVREDRVDTLRIIHRADEDGVRERIYAVDGEPREVLRDGNKVRCLLPGDEPQVMESQLAGRLLPHLPVNRLTSPESAYNMSLEGQDRVAGMMTRRISIDPRDQYRYGYRLWLEESTGMLLRYALTDPEGRQLQQLAFTSIELGASISDSELAPAMTEAPRTLTTLLDDNEGRVGTGRRHEAFQDRVPPGFKLANIGQGRAENGEEFEHLLFSDGLASFSIYLEPAGPESTGSRIKAMGAVHVFTDQSGGRSLTVVGEVPAETVEYVGQRFRLGSGESGPSGD